MLCSQCLQPKQNTEYMHMSVMLFIAYRLIGSFQVFALTFQIKCIQFTSGGHQWLMTNSSIHTSYCILRPHSCKLQANRVTCITDGQLWPLCTTGAFICGTNISQNDGWAKNLHFNFHERLLLAVSFVHQNLYILVSDS